MAVTPEKAIATLFDKFIGLSEISSDLTKDLGMPFLEDGDKDGVNNCCSTGPMYFVLGNRVVEEDKRFCGVPGCFGRFRFMWQGFRRRRWQVSDLPIALRFWLV